jgi:hypothetical protein
VSTAPDDTYIPCSIRRPRRTGEQVDDIRTAIKAVLKADHPQTVRQVFYQLVVRGAIEKTEAEYKGSVIRLLSEMRLDGSVDWDWIVDESRTGQTTRTFETVEDALRDTAILASLLRVDRGRRVRPPMRPPPGAGWGSGPVFLPPSETSAFSGEAQGTAG